MYDPPISGRKYTPLIDFTSRLPQQGSEISFRMALELRQAYKWIQAAAAFFIAPSLISNSSSTCLYALYIQVILDFKIIKDQLHTGKQQICPIIAFGSAGLSLRILFQGDPQLRGVEAISRKGREVQLSRGKALLTIQQLGITRSRRRDSRSGVPASRPQQGAQERGDPPVFWPIAKS